MPLKPKGYRFQVAFPEATTLALEADVRVAGVRSARCARRSSTPAATARSPRSSSTASSRRCTRDARAILRQKTLLGETYVELTPGTSSAARLPEGGRLRRRATSTTRSSSTRSSTRSTRTTRAGVPDLAAGPGEGRRRAAGGTSTTRSATCPASRADAGDAARGARRGSGAALQRLVSNTGVVFGALTENEGQLRGLIANSDAVFSATASQNGARSPRRSRIFPTFLDESRLTLTRLQHFSARHPPADPRPASRWRATSARRCATCAPLAPDLRALVPRPRPADRRLEEGPAGAARHAARADAAARRAGPVPGAAQPDPRVPRDVLSTRSPTSWFADRRSGHRGHDRLADRRRRPLPAPDRPGRRRDAGRPAAAAWPTNRGNAYLAPLELAPQPTAVEFMFPNWDCKPSGGEAKPKYAGRARRRPPGLHWWPSRSSIPGRAAGKFPRVGRPTTHAGPTATAPRAEPRGTRGDSGRGESRAAAAATKPSSSVSASARSPSYSRPLRSAVGPQGRDPRLVRAADRGRRPRLLALLGISTRPPPAVST